MGSGFGARSHNEIESFDEIVQAGAWYNHGIPTSVCFLCDSHEASTIIFPEFDDKMFALDLNVSSCDEVIHDFDSTPSLR